MDAYCGSCNKLYELDWAKEAWEHLIRQGIGNYNNELEKCQVQIRFLALAGLYLDWCYIAWGQTAYPTYGSWAELLGISEFRVGQLVAALGAVDRDGE